jgi:hypothetical protein
MAEYTISFSIKDHKYGDFQGEFTVRRNISSQDAKQKRKRNKKQSSKEYNLAEKLYSSLKAQKDEKRRMNKETEREKLDRELDEYALERDRIKNAKEASRK